MKSGELARKGGQALFADDRRQLPVGRPVELVEQACLQLLGLDHKKLTFRFQGRDFRLTDVHGEIIAKLLA